MENLEKGKFEQEWREAFHGAEGEVPKATWASLDAALSQAESGSMRKRVIFYQRLAAAAVFFALLVGGGTLYFNSNMKEGSLQKFADRSQGDATIASEAQRTSEVDPSVSTNSSPPMLADQKSQSSATLLSKPNSTTSENTVFSPTESFALDETMASIESGDRTNSSIDKIRNRANSYSNLAAMEEPEANVTGKPREVTIWRKLPAFPSSFMNMNKKEKNPNESLWASVGAATGSYNPNMNNSLSSTLRSGATAGALASPGYSQSSDQGTAFSFGVAMGTALSERWVLQGGLNYLTQNLNYQSNVLALSANNTGTAFVADFANRASGASVKVTNPYEIASNNEIISVPMQAGYRIMNRKLALQLNTGIATDVFLRNTLTDKSGQLDTYSNSAGASSPYRTISWAGLLGSEVSYKLADRYRIALVPGLRYSFNSVLKSESGSASNPVIMDVGFRFRYIFK